MYVGSYCYMIAFPIETLKVSHARDLLIKMLGLCCSSRSIIFVIILLLILWNGWPCSAQSRDSINITELFSNMFEFTTGSLQFFNENQHYIDEVRNILLQPNAMYDFVVVGAGTAGVTLAARLSEIPDVQVLLIEAGSHENLFMDIPFLVHVLQMNDIINWNYRSKSSNRYCLGMKDKRCNLPRGKVLGGSSVLNYMIASRGIAEDYDRWAEMGNEGWAYKDVLKYFRKLETIEIPELQNSIYHGTQGPVHISETFHTILGKAFIKAAQELGYPLVDYNNGKDKIGFSYVQATIMNGTRMSSNRAYLHPVCDSRDNLHVTLQSMVRKVLIKRNTNRAIGVEVAQHDKIISVFARKEVIICAGAIGSPQLLMLSGIGPSKQLAEFGIDIVHDAPVGENLMDHVGFFGLTWSVNVPITITLNAINPVQPYLKEFLMKRSGVFTMPGSCEGIGFIDTKHPKNYSGLPDVELLFNSASYRNFMIPIISGLNDQIHQMWSKYNHDHGWNIQPILMKPKSRGRIRLLANDVNVHPEIETNYFDDPDDVKSMIDGIRVAIKIGQSKAMQRFGSQLLNDIPGCEKYEYDSYDYWECAIRVLSSTYYHLSGTCKMGLKEDPTAVVDPKLKVIGVQRLRVVDASIMPEIVRGHTNIPTYMIAEKAADMIKEEWGYLDKSS